MKQRSKLISLRRRLAAFAAETDHQSLLNEIGSVVMELSDGKSSPAKTAFGMINLLLIELAQSLKTAPRPSPPNSLLDAIDSIKALLAAEPLWGTSEAEMRTAAGRALNERVKLRCPECGNSPGFDLARLIVQPLLQQSLPNPPPFIPVAILTCQNCGLLRFYHLSTLGVE